LGAIGWGTDDGGENFDPIHVLILENAPTVAIPGHLRDLAGDAQGGCVRPAWRSVDISVDAHPAFARLWRWHALEETEHKSVAYDYAA